MLRVKCQDNCPWVLYAYQQLDKSLKINIFIDEHTCTRQKNRRIHASYLAKKYIRKFRFDPKMPMSSFMKIVKEDYMYEISKYQST